MLGLKLLSDDAFAIAFATGKSMLRVTKMKQFVPATYTVLGWEVADIFGAVKDLTAKGIVFERYPGMPLDEDGICTFPNGDKVAWFKDPEGNVLSLSQHKPISGRDGRA